MTYDIPEKDMIEIPMWWVYMTNKGHFLMSNIKGFGFDKEKALKIGDQIKDVILKKEPLQKKYLLVNIDEEKFYVHVESANHRSFLSLPMLKNGKYGKTSDLREIVMD